MDSGPGQATAEGAADGSEPAVAHRDELGRAADGAPNDPAGATVQDSSSAGEADGDDLAQLPPDHPLLQRAQDALFQQLSATKLRLEGELRERRLALKDTKAAREQVGVELYGFQQHLARLQLSLECSGERCAAVAGERAEADAALRALRQQCADEEAATEAQQAAVEKLQGELGRLGDTLRQIERYNAEVAEEVALKKRITSATEAGVQQLERAKQEQDFLIDGLQQQLGRLGRQLELHSAQLEAQRLETRAAQEFLAKAVSDMEDVQFEKRALVAQWRSSLLAMQRRDEALELIQDAIQQQQEQQASIQVEVERYRKDAAKERQANEQRAAVLSKLEGQAQYLSAQVERVRAHQAELQAQHAAAQRQLAAREAELAEAGLEGSRLAAQRADLERQSVKLNQATQALEQQLLDQLAEQTSAEKSAQRTVADTKAVRGVLRAKEAALEEAQAALGRTQAEHDAAQARNAQLSGTLRQLDEVLAQRSSGIAALEADMKRRNAEIEAKTRELDGLNRRLLKLTEGAKGVQTGPLEATIANLQREIGAKAKEGRELQRRWIAVQGQLVGLQAEKAELAEGIQHMRAQQAVLQHKRARLSQQLTQQQGELVALGKTLAGLHSETARLNALLAETTGLHTSLNQDNFLLEAKITNQLKDMEAQWAVLQSRIEGLRGEKREVLAGVVAAEREVLVLERKVQLEREMQEAIDPHYGNEEVTALRKEVSRLQHRYGELLREQEYMVQEMERAVLKRDAISSKGRPSQIQKVQDMTVGQLKKAAADLQRGVGQAERETRAVEARLAALGAELAELEGGIQEAAAGCEALREAQAGVRSELEGLGLEKYKALVRTQVRQREAKRLEEAAGGKYRLHVGDPAALGLELERAQRKLERVAAAVAGLAEAEPELRPSLLHVLAHGEAGVGPD